MMAQNKKISPVERGDREMTMRLIALIETNFKEEELAPDWRSKIGKPFYEFIYERPIMRINGELKFLCKPCDKVQERKFLLSKVRQRIEVLQLAKASF